MKALGWLGAAVLAVAVLAGGSSALAADKPGARAEAKININEASKTELMKLEGVGPGTAQKIMAHREAHGPFKRVQDLLKVEGVGKAVLEKNAGRLTVK